LTGHLTSNASLAEENDTLLVLFKVVNHVAAGDFALSDNSKNRTFSVSDRPVFIKIILSKRFMKSCGSWSSGFPVNEQLAISDMLALSRWSWGI
jgi:hypothetical protein